MEIKYKIHCLNISIDKRTSHLKYFIYLKLGRIRSSLLLLLSDVMLDNKLNINNE